MFRSTNPVTPRKTFRVNHAAVGYTLAAAAVVWAGAMTLAVIDADNTPVVSTVSTALPACTTDESALDSGDCFWNAKTQGNGTGHSFVNYNGHTYVSELALTGPQECLESLKGLARDQDTLAFDLASQWAQGATFGEYVITDNLQPMTDRAKYILDTQCKGL